MTIASSFVRTWSDEVALGMQRATESRGALMRLSRDADALDDITHAIRSGSTWDDPMDAVLELAEDGNRGLWDAWTSAKASDSIFSRAIDKHPGGSGVSELRRAQGETKAASRELEDWIRGGGGIRSFEQLEASVRSHMEQARTMGELVLRSAS